jgi:hypothetical protein
MFAWWMAWAPDRATTPFAVMGSIYSLLSGVASVWLIIRALPRR